MPQPEIARAIAGFHGARRRFEHVGARAGVTVMDDYAHHPTEIAATIAAARERFPSKRLVVVFQPHTYSRTAYLLEGFRGCFRGADRLLLLQTYAGAKSPRPASMPTSWRSRSARRSRSRLVTAPRRLPGSSATPKSATW